MHQSLGDDYPKMTQSFISKFTRAAGIQDEEIVSASQDLVDRLAAAWKRNYDEMDPWVLTNYTNYAERKLVMPEKEARYGCALRKAKRGEVFNYRILASRMTRYGIKEFSTKHFREHRQLMKKKILEMIALGKPISEELMNYLNARNGIKYM